MKEAAATTAGRDEARLRQTMAEVLGVGADELSDDASPDTIASWDSLNHLNLIMALEGEFGVNMSPEDALAMRNVGLIRSTLRSYGVEV